MGEVVLFQDRLMSKGGSERVAWLLQQLFDCVIVTAQFVPGKTFSFPRDKVVNLNCWNVDWKGSVGTMLNIQNTIRAFKNYKHDADKIICSGMWCVHVPKRKAVKFWYCHAPDRSVYDLKEYFIRQQKRWLWLPLLLFQAWQEWRDLRNVESVDWIITNGRTVQQRIKRYYGRDSFIVEPVSKDGFYNAKSKGYFLIVSRFEPFKRVELAIEVFRKLPDKELVVVGSKTYGKESFDLPKNVKVLSDVSDVDLFKLYAECEAVICPAMFEDKGITPVEAWKSGKPVIVCDDGEGLLENVKDWNGVTLPEPYDQNLFSLLNNWIGFHSDPIVKFGNGFSVDRFKKEFLIIFNKN